MHLRRLVHMYDVTARPGLIVLDRDLGVRATNPDAVQILTFPENPNRIPKLDDWLENRIRVRLIEDRSDDEHGIVKQFKSAKRTYFCRSFSLHVRSGSSAPHIPAVLIFLERNPDGCIAMDQLAKRFGLTPREQETVKLLLRGLASTEIAQCMRISPNTVKAFIRLVMVKMKVSTRSGIIGKIANLQTAGE